MNGPRAISPKNGDIRTDDPVERAAWPAMVDGLAEEPRDRVAAITTLQEGRRN